MRFERTLIGGQRSV